MCSKGVLKAFQKFAAIASTCGCAVTELQLQLSFFCYAAPDACVMRHKNLLLSKLSNGDKGVL